ncbi:TPA: hypothetical protein HH295_08065 [Xanthomonas vasicola pv. zeae]|uniref:SRPBCC family protein n=1 Tax=Xanthomonas vasicola pv. vasculorum TaxID=325776 RepID=A0AAE8F6A6_XANVA|nr:hypothetical protein [Xanthomonas vasicola]KFA34645.1 hypothetical protein KWS_0111970 [Xanthomonas vasicola pv. musacearum NCPPB 4384]AVQ07192.1 hypothetical protein C7V42_11795 [Xanthomonas vasicola pv. vasculorum]AZM71392.1 hypothetical protein CXP37_11800 [Xanthomonas vasicola pv. vasculorum]AZR30911.1 hypothetical protein KWO_010605 [Xanthomonas vasicola pv. musacearum NCPPB 4379]AZR35005.1 hypothetical protein NX08_011515 [Xanthomonas vasicola]
MAAFPINPVRNDDEGTHIVRSLTIRAEPHQILDAWCDANVQQRILQGAAELVSGDGQASRWRLHAPLHQNVAVTLYRADARLGEAVRYDAEGEHGLRLSIVLQVRPARGRQASEATLSLHYAVEGLLAQLLTKQVDPAPYLLAGKGLRRLRAWLEAGEVPTLLHTPSARTSARSHC